MHVAEHTEVWILHRSGLEFSVLCAKTGSLVVTGDQCVQGHMTTAAAGAAAAGFRMAVCNCVCPHDWRCGIP